MSRREWRAWLGMHLRWLRCRVLHNHGRTICYGTVRLPCIVIEKFK